MCVICNEARHILAAAPYRAECFRDFLLQRSLQLEEAWRSDTPKGKAGALVDRHPFRVFALDDLAFNVARDQDWIRARLLRLRRVWSGRDTTQERLSFID